MSSYTMTVRLSQIGLLRDNFPNALNDYIRTVGRLLQAELPKLVQSMLGPYSTGEMAQSIKVWTGLKGMRIEFGAEQAEYVFKGVGDHWMEPTGSGPMVWDHTPYGKVPRGGSWGHKHPGQAARTDIMQAIKERVREVARREATVLVASLQMYGGA